MDGLDDFPHVGLAIQYAEDVVGPDLTCGKYEILAAQRFLDDLDREGALFHFDADQAEHPCRYIERLPHVKGEWAKRHELLVLEPWQCFNVCNVFGWLYTDDILDGDGIVKTKAGTRRFRTAYTDVARKNAKSTLAAAIGLYMLDADGEAGAEIYSAATTRNQAKITFNIANTMARHTPELPLEVRVHNINKPETAGKFEALHAQG